MTNTIYTICVIVNKNDFSSLLSDNVYNNQEEAIIHMEVHNTGNGTGQVITLEKHISAVREDSYSSGYQAGYEQN